MKEPDANPKAFETGGLFSFLFQPSLKGRLLLWIMPIIVLGLLSLSFIAYSSIKVVIETELSNSMLASVGKSAESINRWLSTIMIEPETIASTPAAKRINEDFHSFDLQNMNRHKSLHKKYPDIFQDIYAANRKGEYHTILEDKDGYRVFVGDIENRPYFRSIMAGGPTQITPPLISRTTGIPTIFMVAPIVDEDNRPQGLIGAGISLKYIQRIAQELKAGKTGYGFIIAKEGTYIYHPNDEFIMQRKITELENPSIKALGKLMVSGSSGMYRYFKGKEPMVAFYQSIPITGWAVATVLPEAELFAPAIKAVKFLMSITLIFAGLIAGAIIYATQRLTRPLQILANRTRQIAAGDFKGGHLTARSSDEIGSLSRSFNEMIDGLESQRSEVKTLVDKLRDTVKDLEKAKMYTTSIIDSMPSILIAVDHDLRITQWNKAAAEITGIPADDARGKWIKEVLPRPGISPQDITQSIESRKSRHLPKVSRRSGGKVFYEDITIFPLHAGNVPDAVIRIDDVTEKVNMEELLIQNEKMLSVGGLAAGMAHEINNPLAAAIQTANVLAARLTGKAIPANIKAAQDVGTTMEAIHDFMDARGVPRMLEAVISSGSRIASIVNNMLSFARKDDSSFSYQNMADLVDQTLELAATDYDIEKHYDFRSIVIQKEVEEDLPMVPCERGKIQQVLLNLFSNGAHSMFAEDRPKDHPSPQFIIRLFKHPELHMLQMEIEDNGKGMDKETRKRIFEPFFTTKSVGLGTGLGLSVSYFIITENHNGTIDVVSHPGGGTNFIIRLPLERPMAEHSQ